MSLVLNGSGTITGITAGGLPDATITQAEIGTNVAGTGPAFSAYQSLSQTPSSSTFTKVQLQTEEFDTASSFNNTGSTVGGIPAYAFLPTTAGYYQINGCVGTDTTANGFLVSIYKNGSEFKRGNYVPSNSASYMNVSALVYLNGSTDYVEFYVYQIVGKPIFNTQVATYFQASMVRAA